MIRQQPHPGGIPQLRFVVDPENPRPSGVHGDVLVDGSLAAVGSPRGDIHDIRVPRYFTPCGGIGVAHEIARGVPEQGIHRRGQGGIGDLGRIDRVGIVGALSPVGVGLQHQLRGLARHDIHGKRINQLATLVGGDDRHRPVGLERDVGHLVARGFSSHEIARAVAFVHALAFQDSPGDPVAQLGRALEGVEPGFVEEEFCHESDSCAGGIGDGTWIRIVGGIFRRRGALFRIEHQAVGLARAHRNRERIGDGPGVGSGDSSGGRLGGREGEAFGLPGVVVERGRSKGPVSGYGYPDTVVGPKSLHADQRVFAGRDGQLFHFQGIFHHDPHPQVGDAVQPYGRRVDQRGFVTVARNDSCLADIADPVDFSFPFLPPRALIDRNNRRVACAPVGPG